MSTTTADETETIDCVVCGANGADARVVGTRARFEMEVRNVACRTCGLVFVNPRPTQRALEEYYATSYRAHYHGVKIPTEDGTLIGPEDEGFAEVWTERHRSQAIAALRLGGAPPGGRVLEVGCGDGTTLRFVRDIGEVEVAGIEPDIRQAAIATERGLSCFAGPMESFDDEGELFDQVQMFHVLEHLRDPLDALVRLSSWLRPGGRLVIEVPNVTQPYGPLEGNFFQNAHIFNFSANTLGALFRRAGLRPVHVVDGGALFLVGEPDPAVDRAELPLAFDPTMLADGEQDGAWIAERLATYRDLERTKQALVRQMSMENLERLCQLLRQPSFTPHLLATVSTLVQYVLGMEAYRVALAILDSVAAGPHRDDIVAGFADSAARLRAKIEELAA